jgi:hypothetical protein
LTSGAVSGVAWARVPVTVTGLFMTDSWRSEEGMRRAERRDT